MDNHFVEVTEKVENIDSIKITIPGKPMGKQRHRMGRGFSYTPKETVNYENLVKVCFMDCVKDHTPFDCPVTVSINAYFPIPQSMKKTDREKAASGLMPYTKKPDCDNVAKIIMDGLNGIAWTDDKIVYACLVSKIYSVNPRVEISITGRNHV